MISILATGLLFCFFFERDKTSYIFEGNYYDYAIQIKPVTEDSGATVKVNGLVVPRGTLSTVNLNVGSNTITVLVTSKDGKTEKTYTLTVERVQKNDSYMSSLMVSGITPVRDASNYKLFYANVVNKVSAITVTPMLRDSNATVEVNGKAVASGSESEWISLDEGSNTITMLVTAESGSKVTYTLTVTREAQPATYTVTFDSQGGSGVASFEDVDSGDPIDSPRDPTRAGYTFAGWYKEASYTTPWDFVTDTVMANTTLYAKWTVVPVTYTVTFDSQGGSAVASATGVVAGAKVAKPMDPTRAGYTFAGWYKDAGYATPWNFGTDNVTANTTLRAKWTSAPLSSNANLSSLSLSNGSLSPAFTSGTTSYTASVANSVNSLTVTPMVADSGATVKVNGTIVGSGTASGAISLSVGSNTITVAATAQNGTTTKIYSLTIQRAAALTADPATPILVTPSTPVTIEVPLGVTDANVAVTPVTVGSNKEATLPLMDIQSATSLGNVSVAIPEGTKITAPASWDGTIKLPVVQSNSSVSVNNASVNAVIEVGSSDVSLTFDHAVRLLIPNMGGKSAGFVRGDVFTPITGTISADTQAAADREIAAGGEAKITVGSDLVIWTKHFTQFAAYTPVTAPTPDTTPAVGGGGGGGSAPSDRFTIGAFASSEFTLGDVKFSIPEGATDKSTQVTVDKVADISRLPKDVSLHLLGGVYEVKKNSDGDFLKPVTIVLPFDRSKVDFNKSDAAVYWLNEQTNKWVVLDNVKVDQASGTVKGSVTHFGKFAVLVSERVQTPSPSTIELTDIKGHWAEADIRALVQTGAINGYPDQTFKPNSPITRAEFVSMLVKALKLTAPTSKTFADTLDNWAKDSIGTAAALGVVSGFEDHTFRPNDLITREQMAAIVVRALKLSTSNKSVSFKDNSAISSWAMEDIAAASEKGLMNGYGDGTFRAKANTTRAEATAVILRAMALMD